MKGNKEQRLLEGEISKTRSLVARIFSQFDEFSKNELKSLGKNRITAVYLAELLENLYTCLETLFHRFSQYFENTLQQDRWHMDLLEKMSLEVPGIRKALISENTYPILLELLKFRQFKWYHFELEYDWDKLEFLQKKLSRLKPLIEQELRSFLRFVQDL